MPNGVSAPGNSPTVPGLTGPVPVPSSGWTSPAGSVTAEAGGGSAAAGVNTGWVMVRSVATSAQMATALGNVIGDRPVRRRRIIPRTVAVGSAARASAGRCMVRSRHPRFCHIPLASSASWRRGPPASCSGSTSKPPAWTASTTCRSRTHSCRWWTACSSGAGRASSIPDARSRPMRLPCTASRPRAPAPRACRCMWRSAWCPMRSSQPAGGVSPWWECGSTTTSRCSRRRPVRGAVTASSSAAGTVRSSMPVSSIATWTRGARGGVRWPTSVGTTASRSIVHTTRRRTPSPRSRYSWRSRSATKPFANTTWPGSTRTRSSGTGTGPMSATNGESHRGRSRPTPGTTSGRWHRPPCRPAA